MSLTPKFGQISEVAQALVPLNCFTEGILTGFCFSMRYPLWMATAASRCRSQPTFVSSELTPSLLLLFHVTGASGSWRIFFLEEKMENAQDFGGTCKWVKRGLPLVFTVVSHHSRHSGTYCANIELQTGKLQPFCNTDLVKRISQTLFQTNFWDPALQYWWYPQIRPKKPY